MLANKTAVITGSTSGIGLGCARAFAEKGANVVINGLGDADEIEKTRAAIEADFGVRCTYSPANMLKGDEIAGMIADAEKEFGGVDILVNNAGIQFVSPVDEFPVDKWDAIIAINLTSAFHAIRAALPGMKSKGWGPPSTALRGSPRPWRWKSPSRASPSTPSAQAMSGHRWWKRRSPTQ